MLHGMEDVQVGLVIRAVRIRRGLRQEDVARAAGVSVAFVSRVERGDLGPASARLLRRVAEAVGVSLTFAPRWRGVELPKLLDEKHASMVRGVIARLTALGWEVRPEHTFSVRGEHGSLDAFAWNADSRAVLVVEVKSLVPDLQAMLSTLDRKRRLATWLAGEIGWKPLFVGAVLVLPDETHARSAVARFRPILDAALPARTVEVRHWLRRPEGDLRGIWFLLNSTPGGTKRRCGGQTRVSPRRRRMPEPIPRSGTHTTHPLEPARSVQWP
jgi:transcriptional regulator with XRE-family HTH domain